MAMMSRHRLIRVPDIMIPIKFHSLVKLSPQPPNLSCLASPVVKAELEFVLERIDILDITGLRWLKTQKQN
jgi:hypothetical protein